MLTSNFSAWIAANLWNKTASGVNVVGTTAPITVGMLGSAYYGIKKSMTVITVGGSTSNRNYGVLFGAGTTPPTNGDHKLESTITSGLTASAPSEALTTETDDYYEITATYGVYATTETTISEIGIFCNTSTTASTNSNGGMFLIDRTVLETPIIIPAGQSKQVTYTIRLNKPK